MLMDGLASQQAVDLGSHATPAVGADVGAHAHSILNALHRGTGHHMAVQARDCLATHQLHLHHTIAQL